jgi:hypothetical protein
MEQTKFFAAQHKAKEELELRYKNIRCIFSVESFNGQKVFEQYICSNNDIEEEKIQVQFHSSEDGSIVIIFYKLTQLITHKV